MQNVDLLFEPLEVQGKRLRNRIVMPPMVVNRNIGAEDGWSWYGRHAAGGVGLVIVEATNVTLFGHDYRMDNLRPLVQAVHAEGAQAAIQLLPGKLEKTITPASLSVEDIQTLVGHYQRAAEVCMQAGFDGVEPHGAHGYLLNRFFSPEQNQRTDRYGGSLEGRMNLGVEILKIIQPIVSEAGGIVLYRHTPVGPGYGIEDSLQFARHLVGHGLDILDISPASDRLPGDRAARFMGLGVPVIAVNRLNLVERALEVLQEKRANLVAVGRGLIADPDWAQKVRQGRFDAINECQDCNECFDHLHMGIPVHCSLWG